MHIIKDIINSIIVVCPSIYITGATSADNSGINYTILINIEPSKVDAIIAIKYPIIIIIIIGDCNC